MLTVVSAQCVGYTVEKFLN